jgi:hypothetical protein
MSRPPKIAHEQPPRGTERALWFALLSPAVLWSAAQIVGVSTIGRGCSAERIDAWQWAVVMSIVGFAIVVTIASVVVAYRTFKRRTGNASLLAAEGWDRVEFLAQAAFYGGVILLVSIVMFGLAPLIIDSCVGARA